MFREDSVANPTDKMLWEDLMTFLEEMAAAATTAEDENDRGAEAAEDDNKDYGEKGAKEKECMIDRAAAPTTTVLSEEVTWTDFELDAVGREGARQPESGENECHSATQLDAMMASLAKGYENFNKMLEDM